MGTWNSSPRDGCSDPEMEGKDGKDGKKPPGLSCSPNLAAGIGECFGLEGALIPTQPHSLPWEGVGDGFVEKTPR